MSEHKWTDVRGWGGALPGTEQCDRCNRVASPTNPKLQELLTSPCPAAPNPRDARVAAEPRRAKEKS